MHLYGIPNCSTVKKARDFLAANDIEYVFHDFKKEGVTEALLMDWVTQIPWEKLVNRAGMTWRNLSEAEKQSIQDHKSAVQLMLEKTSVIKRPVLVDNHRMIALGFSVENYQAILNIKTPK